MANKKFRFVYNVLGAVETGVDISDVKQVQAWNMQFLEQNRSGADDPEPPMAFTLPLDASGNVLQSDPKKWTDAMFKKLSEQLNSLRRR